MFTELYAVARHTKLHISVSPEGERLNVLIIPKPGDDAEEGSALAKPIQAIGTPEELDAELPAKLAEYCAAINELRLKIDMPIEAITAEAGQGGRMKKKASTPSRTPARPSAPTPKKKVAPRPVRPVKKAAPVKPAKSIPAAPAFKVQTREEAKCDTQTVSAAELKKRDATHAPAAQTEQKAAAAQETTPDTERETAADMGIQSACGPVNAGNELPSGGSAPETPASAAAPTAEHAKKSKRASREECLADLRAYLVAQHDKSGIPITRAQFLIHNTTGRSYERKFKSWDEYLAEARRGPGDETKESHGETDPAFGETKSAVGETNAAGEMPAAKETPSPTSLNPALKWPFPDTTRPIEAAKPISRVVYTTGGKLLGTSADQLHIHDVYTHPQFGTFRVAETETFGDMSQRITVEPWREGSTTMETTAFEPHAAKPRLKHTPNGPVPADTQETPAPGNHTAPLFPE